MISMAEKILLLPSRLQQYHRNRLNIYNDIGLSTELFWLSDLYKYNNNKIHITTFTNNQNHFHHMILRYTIIFLLVIRYVFDKIIMIVLPLIILLII